METIDPEKEYGNIEYKSCLVDKTEFRIQMVASQMKFRVDEGSGEAIYVLGVTDSGGLRGVTDEEFLESFENLSVAAKTNSYTITKISEKVLKNPNKKAYELLVREKNDEKYIDIKVAVAGNVDSGKSSLLGVLTGGKLDNGRGSARLSVFNFKHEVTSGRTSSIAHHILGFDDRGEVTNYSNIHKKSWPDIVKESSKIISLFDLCGHEKYLKTTILGLTSMFCDLCFILVGANMGVTRMTQEHIFLCMTLKIPFAVVITKVDVCENRQNVLENTVLTINKLLKMPGLRRIPYKINNEDDVIICAKNVHAESVVPIFHVSNVTGDGIKYMKNFLNLLGKTPTNQIKNMDNVVYHVNSTFYVAGVGTVTGGQLVSGKISIGDKLFIGPNSGKYDIVQVRSIHCKRVAVQTVECGSYVCLGLKKYDRKNIRRGNVMISLHSQQLCVSEFNAEITVLKTHSATIKPGYEPIVHVCSVRQTAKLINIKNKVSGRGVSKDETNDTILRTGDKATVTFRFVYQPEYVQPGSRILMAQGLVKIIGVVV